MRSSLPGSALALVSTILLVSRVAYRQQKVIVNVIITIIGNDKTSDKTVLHLPRLFPIGHFPHILKGKDVEDEISHLVENLMFYTVGPPDTSFSSYR